MLVPESKQLGLSVSQKKAIEVRAFSAYWRGLLQKTHITVLRSLRFGTTEPPVEVQKPMITGTTLAAICTLAMSWVCISN